MSSDYTNYFSTGCQVHKGDSYMPFDSSIYDPYIHDLQSNFRMPGNHLKKAIIYSGMPEIIFLFDELTAEVSRQFMQEASKRWSTLFNGIMPILGLDRDYDKETIGPGTIVIRVS